MKILYIFSFFLFFSVPFTWAHVLPYGAIRTELNASGNKVTLKTEVPQNIAYASYYGHASEFDLINDQFSHTFLLEEAGKPCPFILTSFDTTSTIDRSIFYGTFTCPMPIDDIKTLHIHVSVFKEEFQNFDHFITFSIKNKQWELIFNTTNQDYPSRVGAQYLGSTIDTFFSVAREFMWRGIMHIWTGYDHILFLLSVILLVRSLKKILALVTSFTLAHSLTLLLAGFHIVNISSRVVEPLIALSIGYMAYRNIQLLRKNRESLAMQERWITTFAFGLIHGLGFATALTNTSLPTMLFIPSLLMFNGGIEIGQLSILAVVIPILFYIDALKERRKIFTIFSGAVAVLALIWFFERLLTRM